MRLIGGIRSLLRNRHNGWGEANAFLATGRVLTSASNAFNDTACSAANFHYLRSKRGSTLLAKPAIAIPSLERENKIFLPYYETHRKKAALMLMGIACASWDVPPRRTTPKSSLIFGSGLW